MKELVAKLRIEAEATGDEKIAAMARELEQLAEQGTAAAPAFAELANELRALQTEKGDALGGISEEIDAVVNAATSAAPAVDGLSNALEGVAQPDGLEDTAGQVGALGSAATGAAPAVDGLSNALAGVAQPEGLANTSGQVGDLGKAATGAAPAVDGLSSALEGVAQPEGLAATAGQVGTLGNAAASAAPAVDGLSNAIEGVSQPVGLGDTAGQLDAVGRAAATADPAVGSLERQMGELGSATAGSADALGEMGDAAADARGGVDDLADGASAAADAVSELSGAQPQLEGLAQAIAAIFALAQVKQAAGAAIATADAYGQMAERIRMASSSAEEFDYVQQRLLETANATYRPLAEAQELYIRTAEALRSMGRSTSEALDITDSFSYLLTTNAASADRASSAVDAYAKSIQSGKVESDAWQSILAAMPTLVDALAASTGRSTSEIRQLGVTGKLSLTELNDALQKTVALNKEFAAGMDTTVADAVQRLSNTWALYLGEVNAAYGVTEKLVGIIDTLSDNLDGVMFAASAAGMAALVAATVAAELALRRAAVAVLAYMSSAAGAAAISRVLAMSIRNVAVAYATIEWAVIINNLIELVRQKRALKHATDDLAETQERLANRFGEISAATGVAVTNMAELNAAVEEGRVHFDAVTATWQAGPAALNALAEATKYLGERAQALVTDYYKLREEGKSTSDALKDVFKGITSPEDFRGIQAMGEALAELGKTGEVSARQVDEAWRTALANLGGADLAKFARTASQVFGDSATEAAALTSALRVTAEQLGKMSGTELQQFGAIARKAFEDGRLEAEAFAKINDQVLSASFESLGVNAALALGKVSPAAQDAIGAVDGIVTALGAAQVSAEQSAIAIEIALTEAFAAVDSLPALDALLTKVEGLGAAGKVGAEGLARLGEAAAAARARIEDLTPGIQSVEEAFRKLGITSQAELRRAADEAKRAFDVIRESGKAAPAELKAAFTAYAEAAIEANGGVVDALLQQQAGQVGLRVEADKTGKAVVKTFAEVATAAVKVEESAKGAADSIKQMGTAAEEVKVSLADAAAQHNASIGSIQGTWMRASAASSQYASEAREAVFSVRKSVDELRAAFSAYVSQMEALDRRQQALNSNGARGVEDLQLRLLELNGTEEQIAKARLERDKADVQRQIALLEIDARRASIRGEGGEAQRLAEEIKLLKEQIGLLDQIFKAEQRNKNNPERTRGGGGSSGGGISSGGGSGSAGNTEPTRPAAPVANGPVLNITLTGGAELTSRAEVERLARLIVPELQNLTRRGV